MEAADTTGIRIHEVLQGEAVEVPAVAEEEMHTEDFMQYRELAVSPVRKRIAQDRAVIAPDRDGG